MGARTTYKKECPLGCNNVCTTSHLMCSSCWLKVPSELQRKLMIAQGRRRGRMSFDNLSWVAWAKAAYYAIQSVNPNAAKLQELAELAGIETEEEKEAV